MITEVRIVFVEDGKDVTVIFPESHDLNGPGNEKLFTNVARILIDGNLQDLSKKILKSDLGLAMFDGASIRNSQAVIDTLPFSVDKVSYLETAKTMLKASLRNISTLAHLAMMFYPKKDMYWRITVK